MYDPEIMLKATRDFIFHSDRLITEMETYCALCFQKTGSVIPRYKALLYNFDDKTYPEYSFENIPLRTSDDYDTVYRNLCHYKWQHGYPTIFSIMVLPVAVNTIGPEYILDKRMAMVMMVQTEIQTKTGIYLYNAETEQMEISRELQRVYQPGRNIIRLGYLIGTAPVLN